MDKAERTSRPMPEWFGKSLAAAKHQDEMQTWPPVGETTAQMAGLVEMCCVQILGGGAMTDKASPRAKIHFDFGRCGANYHEQKGNTISGPRVKRVKLTVHAPSTGYRFIFYFPSGAWWHWDIYFDRRGLFNWRGKLKSKAGKK